MDTAHIHPKKEITDDYHAFFARTGMIINYMELEWLGFHLDDFSCLFWPNRLPELLEFCRNNDNYHIVSVTDGILFENGYLPHATRFFLAQGDKNPNFVLNPFLHKNLDLLYEESLDKALAMCRDIDGSHQ